MITTNYKTQRRIKRIKKYLLNTTLLSRKRRQTMFAVSNNFEALDALLQANIDPAVKKSLFNQTLHQNNPSKGSNTSRTNTKTSRLPSKFDSLQWISTIKTGVIPAYTM